MRPADQLFNIRDVIRYALTRFGEHELWYGHGTDTAWDEAIALVFGSLNLDLEGDDRLLDANLTMAERELLVARIDQRVDDKVPTPYLLGKALFHGLVFEVNADTLIPRSPIGELLVDEIEPWLARPPHRILDLCTGSGCLGLLAAQVWPDAEVVLADISEQALAVARRNTEFYDLSDRVKVVQSDLLDGLKSYGPFDLVICNPPYVDQRDMDELPAEYLHEPDMALASGSDGLDHWRRIFKELPGVMAIDAILVGEVGNSWPALEAAYPRMGFTWPELEGDGGVFVVDAKVVRDGLYCAP